MNEMTTGRIIFLRFLFLQFPLSNCGRAYGVWLSGGCFRHTGSLWLYYCGWEKQTERRIVCSVNLYIMYVYVNSAESRCNFKVAFLQYKHEILQAKLLNRRTVIYFTYYLKKYVKTIVSFNDLLFRNHVANLIEQIISRIQFLVILQVTLLQTIYTFTLFY